MTPSTPSVMSGTTQTVSKRYLRTTEVATRLGVSRQHVLRLRKAGKIRGSKIGQRTILWDPDSVEALIASGYGVDLAGEVAS
jgi:excisionase family DNA binding protein